MNLDIHPAVTDTARQHDRPIETDAVIVGAGPVGLFQVFELGLLEIKNLEQADRAGADDDGVGDRKSVV